jgi:CRP/FNR family transcriptional regulator, cyclic AMP receptor protein
MASVVASRRPMAYLLARVPLFAGLSRSQLGRVASLADQRIYREGDVIVKSGEPGKAFYVIITGRAKVMKGRKAEAQLGRGSFFGELALLDGEARSRTVVAATILEAIRIERPAFRRLLYKEPKLAVALLEGMARRTRKIMDAPTA